MTTLRLNRSLKTWILFDDTTNMGYIIKINKVRSKYGMELELVEEFVI
jgi:hypothetical protein